MEGKISRINSNTDLVVDRISALPNSILGDILSFLPTKEAVATSLLSKRWRCAWVTVHNLDFCYHDPQVAEDSAENMDFCYHDPQVAKDSAENMAFIGFVHRVFFLIDAGPLNKFSLDWHAWTISSHVICWIDAAIKRNVRELSLYLGDGDLLKLPISGFNCDSLQSLEVHNFTLVHDATVVCLPRLESLKLDHVHFTSKETFEKLISGCPMLHYLNLTIYFGDHEDSDDVDADGDFMCIISSPSLRRLDIYFGDRCSLKLKASSLEYLRLHGFISEIFVEKSLSSLVQADFDIELDEHDLLNNSIVEAVRAFEHAKFLFLSVDVMRALGHATISLSTEFKRLVKLVARTYCCSVQDFIQNSENLEDLIMYQGYWQLGTIDPRDHSRWTAPVEVPRCLSNSLKKVRLDGYKGLEDEREMIRYMLEHGSALEVMDISCDSEEDVEKLELLQEICEFPRKSSACKVQFCVWPTKEKVPACDILTW